VTGDLSPQHKGKRCGQGICQCRWKDPAGKGDHVNIKMPGGQLITIPVSGEVKIGLLKAAIKKAGLTDEKFEKLL
jgi:predicted RNA binding protein YcfA (HicA-like mRNA interferase family)